jgi:hypothetical protein
MGSTAVVQRLHLQVTVRQSRPGWPLGRLHLSFLAPRAAVITPYAVARTVEPREALPISRGCPGHPIGVNPALPLRRTSVLRLARSGGMWNRRHADD